MAQFVVRKIQNKDGKEIIFRPIIPADAENILAFRKQIALESTNTMQYVGQDYPSVGETEKRLQTQLEDQTTINVGAFSGDKLVAYLNFRLPWGDHPWVAHSAQFGMMVLANFCGLGIGKNLLQIQEEHAKAIGVKRIEAMVRVNNERGLNLYQRNGYIIEGTRRKAALINNQFEDEYFIAKILDEPSRNWRPPTIETSRLILRPILLTDAGAIFQYAKNPNVSKYTLWEPHESISDSENYIKDYVMDYYAQEVPEPFGIALKEDPAKLIGTVGCFWDSKKAKCMELAYAISEEHWGKGFVVEASNAVVDYCFNEFKLKRIQARCKSENKASARVMEKIGMTYEGTLKSAVFHREKYWDMHYYAKVKPSFDGN